MSPLVDIATIDTEAIVVSEEQLRDVLPHDHEFRLVDKICHLDTENDLAVGIKDWDSDPWWAKGHIPGRPLMPGVLMVEGSAQVATVLMKCKRDGWNPEQFIGLGGIDKARFRRTVVPNSRVYFAASVLKQSRKIARFQTQCIQDGEVVMDMELVGVLL